MGAAKHALERLLLGVLGRAGAHVPHAERDAAGRDHDDLVLRQPRVDAVLEADIRHDAVQEAGGQRRAPGAVDAAGKVGGQVHRHVGAAGLDVEEEFGFGRVATLCMMC